MAGYGHIELSSPAVDWDGLRFLTFRSPALGRRGDVTLFAPAEIETRRNVPLILLLHGVYSSHWSWAINGKAHRTAARLIAEDQLPPVVLAMPSDGLFGDGSGYIPHAGADYEKWIVEDVVGCVREVFPCVTQDSKLFIAGLSMGGFGALRLGAKYALLFDGICAHSSITHLAQLARFIENSLTDYGELSEEKSSAAYWLRRNREILPPVRFDCGTSDELIEENRRLHMELEAGGVAHEYFEFAGDHSWDYWRRHLPETLLFFGRVMT